MAQTQTRWKQWEPGQKFHAMKRVKEKGNPAYWEARCRPEWFCETAGLRKPKAGDPPEDDQCKQCLRVMAKG